jgi:hypothetical protein
MQVIALPGTFIYIAATGDWRLVVGDGFFEIQPQVGNLEYSSGVNLDNLAALIVAAKAHALEHDVNWGGN